MNARAVAQLASHPSMAMERGPRPVQLPREQQINPVVLEERKAQIAAQRQLKRQQRELEAKKETLENELASVKENLEDVNSRKRRTRSQNVTTIIEPGQNQVFSVPMSADDVEERSMSAATKRSFEENRRHVVLQRAAPALTPAPPQRSVCAESTGFGMALASAELLNGAAGLISSAAEAVATPIFGWLASGLASAAAGGATPTAHPPSASASASVSASIAGPSRRVGGALRVTPYKRFFYKHASCMLRFGPVTASDLRMLFAEGAVDATTMVFAANGTMRSWLAIGRVAPLHSFVRKPASISE